MIRLSRSSFIVAASLAVAFASAYACGGSDNPVGDAGTDGGTGTTTRDGSSGGEGGTGGLGGSAGAAGSAGSGGTGGDGTGGTGGDGTGASAGSGGGGAGGGDDGGGDAEADAESDAALDAQADGAADAGADAHADGAADAGADAHADGAADAGADAAKDGGPGDAGVCNALSFGSGALVIVEDVVYGTPPAAAGGTLTAGNYDLTSFKLYHTIDGGAAAGPDPNVTRRWTLSVASTVPTVYTVQSLQHQNAGKAGDTVLSENFTFTTALTGLTDTHTCKDGVADVSTVPGVSYRVVSAKVFDLYFTSGSDVSVFEFTSH